MINKFYLCRLALFITSIYTNHNANNKVVCKHTSNSSSVTFHVTRMCRPL